MRSMPMFKPRSLLLAPMVGITNRAFRTLVAELGEPGHFFTEMASAEAFAARAQYEEDYTDPRPLPGKTSIQFFARSEDSLQKACSMVAARTPETRPVGIDINFGCSAPHIRRMGGGSAWSADPEGSARLVRAARAAWPGLLSAKLRMGADDDYGRMRDYCQGLVAEGLDFLTFHPRTDGQKLRRGARHSFTQSLAQDLRTPLVANGDITDPQKFFTQGAAPAVDMSSIHSLMIGRQAVRAPWIFALCNQDGMSGKDGTAREFDRLAIGVRYLELVDALLPAPWKKESCRRFFTYYCEDLVFSHHIKYRLINAQDLAAMEMELEGYFREVPQDRMVVSPGPESQ